MKYDIARLKGLADRLGGATGQEGDLRPLIADALDLWGAYDHDYCLLPEWERSIDAALALIERLLPEWEWRIYKTSAIIFRHYVSYGAVAPTAPLAILRALVAALIAQTEQKDETL